MFPDVLYQCFIIRIASLTVCVSLNNGFGQFHAKVNLTMKKYVFTKRISLYFMALTCFNRNLKEITVYPPHMRGATKVNKIFIRYFIEINSIQILFVFIFYRCMLKQFTMQMENVKLQSYSQSIAFYKYLYNIQHI